MNKNKGFTLLEILVVITMLAILSAMIFNSYINTIKKGRDSRRKQDLEQIAKALELYYDDNTEYPASLNFGQPMNDPDAGGKFFMKQIPQDPQSGSGTVTYFYETGSDPTAGNYYRIYSCLENEQDADYETYAVSCGTGCGNLCHFGLASPNVTMTSP